ncbi:HdeD family acid-resistance protein [Aquibaculum arenosum]|uniref:DUF308 domain-containing protein n=1 Tax=Aquibaculum arenosum TaxID=3032591 RepID=A0ABT5YP94_9PROT|nr:DUF308 domain-containing protein [Fodinicurvata sp. CAU 1616]MDF2096780.1 DUF308 domain-containing protein [Fodinicurvata sp. CAU 1616]
MRTVLPRDADTIRRHVTGFLLYGAVLCLLGLFAILAPSFAAVAISLLLGWLLLIAGALGIFAVFRSGSSEPGYWSNLLMSVVFLLAGATLLWRPLAGVLTLTIILAAYFLATGLFKLGAAARYRSTMARGWTWMLVSGVIDLVLGLLIVFGLPGSADWVLGLLVGINLLFTGLALVMTAMALRTLQRS